MCTVAALLLALVAIGSELRDKHQVARALILTARATTERPAEPLRAAARWHLEQLGPWHDLGVGCAVVALGCWIVGHSLGQTGATSALIVLAAVYLLVLMIIV